MSAMKLRRTCFANFAKRANFTSSIHIVALLLLGANQCFTGKFRIAPIELLSFILD